MAFKDDSRLDSSRIERTGSTRSGKGAALGGGLGGAALLLLVAVFFGQDGVNLLNQVAGADYSFSNIEQENAGETLTECKTGTDANSNSDCNMVGTANSLDNFWSSFLPTAAGVDYQPPRLRLFSGSTDSACGRASSAVGPFYCPADQKGYVDTSFFQVMQTQLGASGGQSAEQYVLAHEYGHHVQNLLGDLKYSQTDPKGANSGAVRVELQADCYAGLWAHHASQDSQSAVQLEPFTQDEIKRIVNATEVIGDDHIQMTSQGHTDSSTYTHGTSAQRTAWFMAGYESGDMKRCNTFESADLNQP